MARLVVPCIVVLILATSGCNGKHRYVPNITLTKAAPTIDVVAEFHNLYPSFALLSGKETFGLVAPTVARIEPAELTREVEHEVLTKLDAAGVFSRVTRFDQHPDVILAGRIMALHEHYRPQRWATIKDAVPYGSKIAELLRLKTHISTGEVHLTLYVLKATGEVLGIYTGKSSFNETFSPHERGDLPPGTFLNRALSETVHQIVDELSHDPELTRIASSETVLS